MVRERELIDSVVEALNQGERLLDGITQLEYSRKIAPAYNSSIGGHYRHCLDHFRALLDAAREGNLNYDDRERGTLVETDIFVALQTTRELRDQFQRLNPMLVFRPLVVTCKTSYASAGSQAAPSTVGREIMYSVAHAVHHYALIGVMAGIVGVNIPPVFGVAPSTLKHAAETAGASS